jgi:hypothetical protein
MTTLRFNGEYWYEDERPTWKRIQERIAWIGGWQTHGPKSRFPVSLRQRLSWELLTPIALFGHRIVLYRHWFDVRTPYGTLVVNLRERYAFISHNGTPTAAHTWLYGAPHDIREAARERRASARDRHYAS